MKVKLHFISDMSKQIVLFPHRMDEKIAADDPVRVLDSLRERKGKRGYLTNKVKYPLFSYHIHSVFNVKSK